MLEGGNEVLNEDKGCKEEKRDSSKFRKGGAKIRLGKKGDGRRH